MALKDKDFQRCVKGIAYLDRMEHGFTMKSSEGERDKQMRFVSALYFLKANPSKIFLNHRVHHKSDPKFTDYEVKWIARAMN